MAVKKKRVARKHVSEMDERDWEECGERFGKCVERWGNDFGKKMESKGRCLEARFEKKFEKGHWWHVLFGPIGPLLKATFSLVLLIVVAFLFGLAGEVSKLYFFKAISSFLYLNSHWFFLAYLVFDYGRYLKCVNRAVFRPVKPLVSGVRAAFTFWILAFVFELANIYVGGSLLSTVAQYINANLAGIFVLFAVIGYALFFALRGCCCEC